MTIEEIKEHCVRQITEFERIKEIMPVTPNGYKRYEEHKIVLKREIALSGEYQRAYKRGKQDAEQTGWIPVSERLPEDKTYVLTTIKVSKRIAHARSGWYDGGFFMNDNGDTWRATDKEVIAWMPLPEPFEPQESEDKNCKNCIHYGNFEAFYGEVYACKLYECHYKRKEANK